MPLPLLLLLACTGPDSDTEVVDTGPLDPGASPYSMDDVLRLNHVQAKGTHNSYHQQPDSPIHPTHYYTQPTLTDQLALHGVRQFEIDLHYRTGVGFEVFHIPLVDQETSCQLLVDCLAEVKTWSDDNLWHVPIVIWFEPKDDADALDPTLELITGHYDEIDSEVRSVFPERRLFTPAELKGDHADLPTRLAADGWPALGELRGQVLFVMLDGGEHRDGYLDGTNGFDRAIFVGSSNLDDPFAAFWKINDGTSDHARDTVAAGHIVTSNIDGADSTDEDAMASMTGTLDNGVQFSSSDVPAQIDTRDYWFDMPGGSPRCNVVTAPEPCSNLEIENLSP